VAFTTYNDMLLHFDTLALWRTDRQTDRRFDDGWTALCNASSDKNVVWRSPYLYRI